MKNYYPYEKFSKAIYGLATSPKSIQQRVCDAYTYNVGNVSVDTLPEEIRSEFQIMKKRLTESKPDMGQGTVKAATDGMSDNEASEIAAEILRMYDIIETDIKES